MVNVGKYTSPMDAMGLEVVFFPSQVVHHFFPCQLGGISEILLPDKEGIIKLGYTKYRWPPQECQMFFGP